MPQKTRPSLADDGLVTPEIGPWSELKHNLFQAYARVFATSMKNKWERVYVDLFAGSGRARIRETSRIVLTSPFLAIELPDRFNQYVFCEKDPLQLSALRLRVSRDYPEVKVQFVEGDCNEHIHEILKTLPLHGKQRRVLTFCFADPWNLENLKFSTIKFLSERFVDFLILIPTWMDANRNVPHYLRPENKTMDNFVGSTEWRKAWQHAESRGETFDRFLTTFYAEQMKQLGYLDHAAEETQLIRSDKKNLPLYRLAFFSRHPLGEQFWKEVKKHINPQTSLRFE